VIANNFRVSTAQVDEIMEKALLRIVQFQRN
jgi:hypothetical protein